MKIVACSDIHAPSHYLPGVTQLVEEMRDADVVVFNGDIFDFQAMSKYAHNPDLPGGGDEIEKCRELVAGLSEATEGKDVFILDGNHEYRAYKRRVEAGLPNAFMRPISDVMGFPPHWRIMGRRKHLGPFVFLHGATQGRTYGGVNAAVRIAEKHRRSTVIGHIHTAGYVRALPGVYDTIWACACGCLIDPLHPAFGYAIDMPERPALGYVVIEDWVPRWVPVKDTRFVNLTDDELRDYMEAQLVIQESTVHDYRVSAQMRGFHENSGGLSDAMK